jgi:hypothetical protein
MWIPVFPSEIQNIFDQFSFRPGQSMDTARYEWTQTKPYRYIRGKRLRFFTLVNDVPHQRNSRWTKVYPKIQPLVPTPYWEKINRKVFIASAPYCTQTKMNTVCVLQRNTHRCACDLSWWWEVWLGDLVNKIHLLSRSRSPILDWNPATKSANNPVVSASHTLIMWFCPPKPHGATRCSGEIRSLGSVVALHWNARLVTGMHAVPTSNRSARL